MKIRKIAGLFLLAPLTLCAACAGGVQHMEIRTNWYRNTFLGDDIRGTRETLEYEVTMPSAEEGGSAEHNGLTAEYTGGVYTMSLKNATIELDNAVKEEGYVLETSLSIDVRFTYGGQTSAALHDVVTSRVEFRSAGENLKPVYSTKTAHTHVPNDVPSSLETSYAEYHYTYEVEYDDGLTLAAVTFTDHLAGSNGKVPEPVKSEVDIEGKSTFLDNEQILFALRGVNLLSAPVFRTLDPTMGTVQEVSLRQSTTEVNEAVHASFEQNGEPFSAESIAAYECAIGYRNNIGQERTIVFAKTTDPNENVYRNVPLRIEYPILRSLGKLRYTLKKATFNDK